MNSNPSPYGKPGSVGFRAIAWLQARYPEPEFPTIPLAMGIGCTATVLKAELKGALADGLLTCRKLGTVTMWALGPNSKTHLPRDEDEKVIRRIDAEPGVGVMAYSFERNAAPFSTALSSDGRLRVERYGRLVCEFNDQERIELLKSAALRPAKS